MAVAFDVASESHTGTTGSTSQTSFNWNHAGGASARGALVFAISAAAGGATNPTTGVTYGGVAMTAVPYTATDTDTEPGNVTAYYLDNCGTGTKNIVVSRTNNTTIVYAVCFTVTAAGATEVHLPGVRTMAPTAGIVTAGSASGAGTGTAGLLNADDGSPGTDSLRFAGLYFGGSSVLAAGSGSTAGPSIDFGIYVASSYYETTASQGNVGVGSASGTDDLAMIALAVRETPAPSTDEPMPYIGGGYYG